MVRSGRARDRGPGEGIVLLLAGFRVVGSWWRGVSWGCEVMLLT